MPVLANHLTTAISTVDGTSYNTASISPIGGKLILAFFAWAQSTPGTPSVSGNGLTWVQHGSTKVQGARAGALFRTMGGTPSSGAVTFTITGGSGTPSRAGWSISEFNNVETSGASGANAILQPDKNNSTASGNSLTVTLDAFSSVNNATFGGIVVDGGGAITNGSGFTELGEANDATEGFSVQSQFKDTNDTSVDWTTADTTILIAIAAEIIFVAPPVSLNNGYSFVL